MLATETKLTVKGKKFSEGNFWFRTSAITQRIAREIDERRTRNAFQL